MCAWRDRGAFVGVSHRGRAARFQKASIGIFLLSQGLIALRFLHKNFALDST